MEIIESLSRLNLQEYVETRMHIAISALEAGRVHRSELRWHQHARNLKNERQNRPRTN
jgi:hypothetical protein